MNEIVHDSDSDASGSSSNDSEKDPFTEIMRAVEERFPDIGFDVACCFESVEEIETKVLTDAPKIWWYQELTCIVCADWCPKPKSRREYFPILRLPDQTHIRYCDVVDQLNKQGFEIMCNHIYLELIREVDIRKGVPVFKGWWGS